MRRGSLSSVAFLPQERSCLRLTYTILSTCSRRSMRDPNARQRCHESVKQTHLLHRIRVSYHVYAIFANTKSSYARVQVYHHVSSIYTCTLFAAVSPPCGVSSGLDIFAGRGKVKFNFRN